MSNILTLPNGRERESRLTPNEVDYLAANRPKADYEFGRIAAVRKTRTAKGWTWVSNPQELVVTSVQLIHFELAKGVCRAPESVIFGALL